MRSVSTAVVALFAVVVNSAHAAVADNNTIVAKSYVDTNFVPAPQVPTSGTTANQVLKSTTTTGQATWGTLTASDVGALPSTYTAPVTSVAGKTGAVTLVVGDVTNAVSTTQVPASTTTPNQVLKSNGTAGSAMWGSLNAGDVGAVASNTAITGATKTKITYDAKGLVTAGADLTAADIPPLDASKITTGTLNVSISATNLPLATMSARGASRLGAAKDSSVVTTPAQPPTPLFGIDDGNNIYNTEPALIRHLPVFTNFDDQMMVKAPIGVIQYSNQAGDPDSLDMTDHLVTLHRVAKSGDAAELLSSGANNGDVLTANGSGGVHWMPQLQGGNVMPSGGNPGEVLTSTGPGPAMWQSFTTPAAVQHMALTTPYGGIKMAQPQDTVPVPINPSTSPGQDYPVRMDSRGIAYVNVPWYAGVGGGGGPSGNMASRTNFGEVQMGWDPDWQASGSLGVNPGSGYHYQGFPGFRQGWMPTLAGQNQQTFVHSAGQNRKDIFQENDHELYQISPLYHGRGFDKKNGWGNMDPWVEYKPYAARYYPVQFDQGDDGSGNSRPGEQRMIVKVPVGMLDTTGIRYNDPQNRNPITGFHHFQYENMDTYGDRHGGFTPSEWEDMGGVVYLARVSKTGLATDLIVGPDPNSGGMPNPGDVLTYNGQSSVPTLSWQPGGGGGGNVQSNWNATSGSAQILNKPTVNGQATGPTSFYAPTASGTAGNVLLSGGNGASPSWLGHGAAGHVLTMNSSGNGVQWAAASGGSVSEIPLTTGSVNAYIGSGMTGFPTTCAAGMSLFTRVHASTTGPSTFGTGSGGCGGFSYPIWVNGSATAANSLQTGKVYMLVLSVSGGNHWDAYDVSSALTGGGGSLPSGTAGQILVSTGGTSAAWKSALYPNTATTSTNVYTVDVPTFAFSPAGNWFFAKMNAANTGAATLNVNGLGAKNITHVNGTAIASGALKLDVVYSFVYDGTQFKAYEVGGGGGGASYTAMTSTTANLGQGGASSTITAAPNNATGYVVTEQLLRDAANSVPVLPGSPSPTTALPGGRAWIWIEQGP